MNERRPSTPRGSGFDESNPDRNRQIGRRPSTTDRIFWEAQPLAPNSRAHVGRQILFQLEVWCGRGWAEAHEAGREEDARDWREAWNTAQILRRGHTPLYKSEKVPA